MQTKIKCPFCYSWFPAKKGRKQRCHECLTEYEPVRLDSRGRFSLGTKKFRLSRIDNHPVIPARHGFAHESFRHPDLEMLRSKYALPKVIKPHKDEFTQQLAVRDWVCTQATSGQPSVQRNSRRPGPDWHVDTMITKARENGNCYFCSYKAIGSVQISAAYGWSARLVNNMGHMIYETWSNQLDKWVLHDSLFNFHYEKKGIPLSAREIRLEYFRNEARDVRHVYGVGRHDIGPAQCDGFKWYVIYMHNNFFDFLPGDHIHPLLMPRDEHNKGKHWRQGKQVQFKIGDGYVAKGIVHEVSDPVHLDYPINQTEIFLVRDGDKLTARFQHNMPNFSHLEARLNEGKWRKFPNWRDGKISWRPTCEAGTIKARSVNTLGVRGPTATVVIEPV